ncbi:MAG: heat shock protein HspQ [Proteobacteria bacterium]|nr:heat shock protein HspQ [Pseudomonadota bacterium]
MPKASAIFNIGDVVRHRHYSFRGVVFDVDAEFDNTEEWYNAIPRDSRPRRDQPFYHLLAENEEVYYTAYVSQQNLVLDGEAGPVDHPELQDMFETFVEGRYKPRHLSMN